MPYCHMFFRYIIMQVLFIPIISFTVVLQLFTLLFVALVVYVDIFCLSLLNAVWLHFLASVCLATDVMAEW